MALVLAIEPDSRQASILKRVIREGVHAELVVVDSRDAAVAAIAARVPDVILMTALLSPRDGDELIAHLRTLTGADHVQTHTIPQLASSSSEPETQSGSGGLLGKFRKKKASAPIPGCDPTSFANEVTTFIARAEEMKARAPLSISGPSAPPRARVSESARSEFARDPQAAPAGDLPEETDAAASAWASPFEWRRADAPAERAPAERVEARATEPSAKLPLVTSAPLAVVAEEEELRLAEEADRHAAVPARA